jgi:hypothetical protein
MEGAPPARQRALNTRGGLAAAGLDTLIFRFPGTTQLVEGAALIRRYRQVRSLGARQAGGATGWRSDLINRRLRVQLPSGLPEGSFLMSKQAAGQRIRLPALQAFRRCTRLLPGGTEFDSLAGYSSAASAMESAPGFYPGRSGFDSSAAHARPCSGRGNWTTRLPLK